MSASYLDIDGTVANMYRASDMVLVVRGGPSITLPANTPGNFQRVPVSAEVGSIIIAQGAPEYQGYFYCAAHPPSVPPNAQIDASVIINPAPGQKGVVLNWTRNGQPESWKFIDNTGH